MFRHVASALQGTIILDKKTIAITYLRGWLMIDLISSIPFDLILLFAQGVAECDGQSNYFKASRAIKFLRMGKLLSLLRVTRKMASQATEQPSWSRPCG